MIELAVAVIIAGAFATIVASMTADLIMPLVGAVFGDVDFSNKYIVLSGEVDAGMSLEAAREAAPKAPAGPTEIELLQEIRDALKGGAPGAPKNGPMG